MSDQHAYHENTHLLSLLQTVPGLLTEAQKQSLAQLVPADAQDESKVEQRSLPQIWQTLFGNAAPKPFHSEGAVGNLYDSLQEAQLTRDQATFDKAADKIFSALDVLEAALSKSRFLKSQLTLHLADVELWPLLVRLDAVYYPLYRLNRRRLVEYPALYAYARDVHMQPGVMQTLDMEQLKRHMWSTFGMELSGRTIVPKGGESDLWLPHDRHIAFAAQAALECEKTGAAVSTALSGALQAAGVAGEEKNAKELKAKGAFVRGASKFRSFITKDGSTPFKAEPNRYVLYVSHNCPWSHRCALAVGVLGLESVIKVLYVHYRRDPDNGWQFRPELTGDADTVNGVKYIPELYKLANPESTEKSVPVLWDTKEKTIVSNESADIVRMFNNAFGEWARTDAPDLYPEAVRPMVDQLNAWVYPQINNGAYKAGFASSQDNYDVAFDRFFSALDRLEAILGTSTGNGGIGRPFLTGATFTEADLRLFPTIFRFDHVYYTRFRLNKCMIRDSYPLLSAWLHRVYAIPGVAKFSNLEHCILGYFGRTGSAIIPTPTHFQFGQVDSK